MTYELRWFDVPHRCALPSWENLFQRPMAPTHRRNGDAESRVGIR
jgi:hypothetical protein